VTPETDAAQPGGRARELVRGRGGLSIPLVMAAVSTLVVIGILQMDVPPDTPSPGPRFFPGILAVAGYLLAALLTLHHLRHPEPAEPDTRFATHSDWRALGWVAGGFLAFAVLLDLLGWILAAGLLFWCVARAFGSKTPGFDASVALVTSSAIYLVFAVVIDLPLPSGILGGL
jgi:putative tricarboxylic transport membrane protein